MFGRAGEPTVTTTTDIGNALDILAEILERWDRRLKQMTDELPGPIYATDTDEALNLEAVLQSRISAALEDEVRPVILTLRTLSGLVAEQNKPN